MEEIEEVVKPSINLKVEMKNYFSALDHHYDGIYKAKTGKDSLFRFIKEIIVENEGEEIVPALVLKISFNTEILEAADVALDPIEKGEYKVDIPFINANYDLINKLTSSTPCEAKFEILDSHSGDILCSVSNVFSLLPLSQLYFDEFFDVKMFAKLVTPSSPFVKQITYSAVINNDGHSIVAYQNKDENGKYNTEAMLKELNALYVTIHEQNIIYQNPPASDQIFQKIRMADEIKVDKKATCLDSSILFCSCLEELGYHSLLVLIEGHAFVGVFLTDPKAEETPDIYKQITYSKTEIAPLLTKGNEQIVFIETTTISANQSVPFAEARNIATGKARVAGDDFVAISIFRCHTEAYSPVPTTGNDDEICATIKAKKITNNKVEKIDNKDLEDVTSKYELDRFKIWQRKLLDLKESNRLVNLKPTFSNSARIIVEDVTKLEETPKLLIDNVVLSKKPEDTLLTMHDDVLYEELSKLLGKTVERTPNTVMCLSAEKNLNKIIKANKSAIDETGAPTLYLCLGAIVCEDPKEIIGKSKKKTELMSPFMLLPVEIIREPNGKEYLVFDTDNLKVNETFFEFYRYNIPDIDFSSLYDFKDITRYYDACLSFKNLCSEMNVKMELLETVALVTNLSFSHQVMYLDMLDRQEELSENKVIQSIINGGITFTEELIEDDASIEQFENYKDFVAPLPYDSSQLKAILDCGAGKSFILDGPPGTGKSQTIVNMITNAFYNGKKVLFIAEKKTALDVVYKRMTDIQLDRYCLELHSNKANKGDFFKKIGQAIDFGSTKEVEGYKELCEKLNSTRDSILETINGMHVGKLYYYSLYDSIVLSKQHAKYANCYIPFDDEFLTTLDDNKMSSINSVLESYVTSVEDIYNFNGSPLKYLGVQGINLIKDKDAILLELKEISSQVEQFSTSITKLFKEFPMELKVNYQNAIQVLDFYHNAFSKKYYFNDVYALLAKEDELNAAFKTLAKMHEYKAKMTKEYDIDKLLSLDIQQLSDEFRNAKGLFKGKAQKKVCSELAPYVKYDLTPSVAGKVFIDVEDYRKRLESFDKDVDVIESISGLDANTLLLEYDTVVQVYADTKTMLKAMEELGGNDVSSLIRYFVKLATGENVDAKLEYEYASRAFEKYKEYYSILRDKYVINEYALNLTDNYFDKLQEILSYAADTDNFEDLATLSSINKLRNGFEDLGILSLIDAMVAGICTTDEMEDLFIASLANLYLKKYCEIDTVSGFLPAELNKKIDDYKKLIDEYRGLSVSNVSAKLSKDFAKPGVTYGNSSKIGGLKKACTTNGKGVSIRGVLSAYSDVIMDYLPCFLMSPLSAAQYLAVDSENGKAFPKFDIVIFDEASQIPTHEAVGPIARGTSLIVAGDPKQMPPSPYTRAELEDESLTVEDKNKFGDSQSLLDECLAISMPRHRLTYHYRSKHESLIQFSNANFYSGQLRTFPSSSTASSFVEFQYINVKKNDSTITKTELEAICNKVKEIYTNDKTKKMSLGIISFNLAQADRIESEINKMLDKNPDAKANYLKATEKDPMFVKNIENVQGDERDIIIMCVGFALTKSGTAKLGGPLIAGDNNGERRLNVCASRAKERMILLSTLKSTDFKEDSKIINSGERCLKNFIRYCEASSFERENGHRIGFDNIIFYLQKELNAKGYLTDTMVGTGDFAVDLAVKSKDSDQYQLGIIIDTKAVSLDTTCRDKFYLHESVLHMMKWKIIYVYALEYYLRPKQTVDKIINAINESIKVVSHSLKIDIKSSDEENPYTTMEYKIPKLKKVVYNPTYGFDTDIIAVCETIVKAISPISFDTLKNTIAEYSLGAPMNKAMEKNFKTLVDMSLCNMAERDTNAGKDFYYKDSNRAMKEFYNVEGRDVLDISKYEIMAVFKQVLDMQPGLNEEDLFRISMEALKLKQKTLTKAVKDRFGFVYKEYQQKN